MATKQTFEAEPFSSRTFPMKRMLDVAIAGSALVVTAPVWPIIAVAVKLESPGPAFFTAKRVGRGGALFSILKFRSMTQSAAGPAITSSGDARITRVGRLLRATKLDELPQLINVLRGDMSVVGPRPEDPRYVERYSAEQRRVLLVRPGITGAAAVAYRHEQELLARSDDPEVSYITSILPAKLELELAYLESWSLLTDVRLIVQTVTSIFSRHSDIDSAVALPRGL